jgi:hypothetical protein
MPIPAKLVVKLVDSLQDGRIQNLFAQAQAKHVLHEVGESPDNFPEFDAQLDDKVTFAAYALLAAGCSMLEQQGVSYGIDKVETAASLLESTHGPFAEQSRASAFHILVSSIAFYAAGQYSRAFVSIRRIEATTDSAGIIAAFIRKDIETLVRRLSGVLLRDNPDIEDQADLDEWVITVAIARAIASVLEYLFTGSVSLLQAAYTIIEDALVISAAGMSPAYWWVVRLLKLMLTSLDSSSLWRNLPPHFGPESREQVDRYIRSMAFCSPPTVELWISQQAALSIALDQSNRGGVVNLRTSAGKTRVAELAILKALSSNSTAKVLYLAPFRSLAFELERTLSTVFAPLGFNVSHLYGGLRVSSVDMQLASESAITIATPEKAKALFRAAPDLFENMRLIIVDEGHLIGRSERDLRNELFLDHLRVFAQSKGARILLLSAVLPNAEELANWVAGDSSAVANSSWKPSAERFGLLRWNGERVRIDWLGDVGSFNPSFVEAQQLVTNGKSRLFPKNKIEAVAATAVRLASIGPVMIFSGRAVSVPTLGEAVLLSLGDNPQPHPWPEQEWRVFEAVCAEEIRPDSIEVAAAKVGVICHSNRLTPQVRIAVEHLMRSCAPKIIIATTTLGQGVNIGVSSVIVATPYIGQETLSKRDFWNICGRAGRAFVDREGKVLYAIDEVMTKKRTMWHLRKDRQLAKDYFNASSTDRVESGLLLIIKTLRQIALEAGIAFELLIELVAENDFSKLGANQTDVEGILDLLDDGLLALHEDLRVNPSGDDSLIWVDDVFRHSLAGIQADIRTKDPISSDDIIRFLEARTRSTLKRVPDKQIRRAVAVCGLPLSIAIKARRDLEYFREIADAYCQSAQSIADLSAAVRAFEGWARMNASSIVEKMPDEATLDGIREMWLAGTGLNVLSEIQSDAPTICRELYGYQLPWVIHALSQTLDMTTEEERISALVQIALLVEIGVPTDQAARVFLSGIRSRVAATEISQTGMDLGSNVSNVADCLRDPEISKLLALSVSAPTKAWLGLLLGDASLWKKKLPSFPRFTLKSTVSTNILHCRTLGDALFLCSYDGKTRVRVKPTKQLPFSNVADDHRIIFVKSREAWEITSRDPRTYPTG